MSTFRELISRQLRELRKATGLSLERVEQKHGIRAVVLGSYERGQRNPTADRLNEVLRLYGHELRIVPVGAVILPGSGGPHVWTPTDMASVLSSIAEFLAASSAPSAAELAALRGQLVEQRPGGSW